MKFKIEDDLVTCLVRNAEEQADVLAFKDISKLFPSSVAEGLSYFALDQKARAIAATLQDRKLQGTRALLIYTSSLDFIASFYGCLYAGVVPVPAFPPDPARLARTIPRLQAVAFDAQVSILLSTASSLNLALPFLQQNPVFAKLPVIATDEISAADVHLYKPVAINPKDMAFLQYTSGSTSQPKGVIISHAQVIANCRQMFNRIEDSPHFAETFVSWVPLYHDFGLISTVIYSVSTGASGYLMSPLDFLSDPLSWLENISRYRGTVSAAPNFAFELCARKASAERVKNLDLSSWKMAMCGGEPISQRTMENFYQVFAGSGLRRETLFPGYGLAESVVCATACTVTQAWTKRKVSSQHLQQGLWQESTAEDGTQEFVSCGKVLKDVKVKIVDPNTHQALPEKAVGEIWLQGPNVATGYWQRPADTKKVFQAELAGSKGDFYLRTGDLGVLDEGHLFVTGRIKDLIIVGGRNIYPQDVELSIEQAHKAVRPGTVAFFSSSLDDTFLVAVLEVSKQADTAHYNEVIDKVRAAIQQQNGLAVDAIVLIETGTCLKTSSGKIQRQATQKAYAQDKLSALVHWKKSAEADRSTPVPGVSEPHETRQRLLAIIGGGPSGLVAAAELAKLGTYEITVFEKQRVLGGRSTDYFDFRGRQFSEVFIANDQYQVIQSLAKDLNIRPMYDMQNAKGNSRSYKSELVQTYLVKPDTPETVAAYDQRKALTIESRPGEDQTEVLQLMTLAGYGYGETIPQAYRQLFASISTKNAFDPFKSLVRKGFFTELWQALGASIGVSPSCKILNDAQVTLVSLEKDGRVRIRTENDPIGKVFDQVLISCLPKDAIKFLDPRDFATTIQLFQKVEYNRYGILVFQTDKDLPADSLLFPENFSIGQMGRPLAIYKRGDTYYSLQYAQVPGQAPLGNEQLVSLLSEQLAKMSVTMSTLVTGHFHSFFPHVSGPEMARGFYEELKRLQGNQNLFYLGALAGFELTETVARQAKELVSTYFSAEGLQEHPETVFDGNEEVVDEWIELLRKFPTTPPQFGAFMPKYYTIEGSTSTYSNASLNEVVMQGNIQISPGAAIPAQIREGLWALSEQTFPVVATFKVVPDPQIRLRKEPKKYSYVLTVNISELPAKPTFTNGSSSELEFVFFSVPELFPVRIRDGLELLQAQVAGENANELFRRPDLKSFIDKAFQPQSDPFSVHYSTFGVPFVYDLGEEFGVLHMVPQESSPQELDSDDPIAIAKAKLNASAVVFAIKLQTYPKSLLPKVGSEMESPGWRQWNAAAPWCETQYPLQTIGTITFKKQQLADSTEPMKEPHCGNFFLAQQWQSPKVLMPSGCRALIKVHKKVSKISKAEFNQLNQGRVAESLIINWASQLIGTTISARDNLVELGISSLQLIQLAGYLETVFAVPVPLTIFMDLPDIASVGKYVQAIAAGETFSTRERIRVISLLKGNSYQGKIDNNDVHLFCLPPIVGSGDVYRPLSAAMRDGISLISLNDLLFYNEVPTDVMIPELAKAYAERIRELQPIGSIHLMGYSFGATLAYEVACQLRAAGRTMGIMIFLDGPAPCQMWNLADINKDVIDVDTTTGKMINSLLAAGSRYFPQADEHPVELIRAADDNLFTKLGDDTLGWGATAKRHRIHWVRGDHLSILKPPFVAATARVIGDLFKD